MVPLQIDCSNVAISGVGANGGRASGAARERSTLGQKDPIAVFPCIIANSEIPEKLIK